MDTLSHVILFLLVSSVFAVPAQQVDDDHDDNHVLHVLRCRTLCLDEFIGALKTEVHCRSEKECQMCWDACALLHTNYSTWGAMCTVRDICLPGCQQACSTVTTRKDISRETDESVSLHSLYDPQTDKVMVEWKHPRQIEFTSSILYAVLLKEKNGNCQEWEELTQTTSHVIQVKRGLLGRYTDIRLIAANASGQVTDIVASYVDTLVAQPDSSGYEEEHEVPQMIHSTGRWRPHLLSIRQSHKSLGVQATVTWPLVRSPGAAKYEVSWNVIDDTIEITGHLQTSSNMAVLTLWPNALYSVQINAYVDNEDPVARSEPLVIDTRLEKPSMSVSSVPLNCKDSPDLVLVALCMLTATIVVLLAISFLCRLLITQSCISCANGHYEDKDSIGNTSISESVCPPHIPRILVSDSKEQLINCSLHCSPYAKSDRPHHTHIDLGNTL